MKKKTRVIQSLIVNNPCDGCTECCEYVALEIDKPENLKDFENVLWFILHKNVWVYIDFEGDWYIQFDTPCKKLNSDGLCDYYQKRPSMCRDYSVKDCTNLSSYGSLPGKIIYFH
jgi:Fe-S-cluster containining protein